MRTKTSCTVRPSALRRARARGRLPGAVPGATEARVPEGRTSLPGDARAPGIARSVRGLPRSADRLTFEGHTHDFRGDRTTSPLAHSGPRGVRQSTARPPDKPRPVHSQFASHTPTTTSALPVSPSVGRGTLLGECPFFSYGALEVPSRTDTIRIADSDVRGFGDPHPSNSRFITLGWAQHPAQLEVPGPTKCDKSRQVMRLQQATPK